MNKIQSSDDATLFELAQLGKENGVLLVSIQQQKHSVKDVMVRDGNLSKHVCV